MSKVFLGIDGGGTKTHAAVVDLNGNILATAANGEANWERIGLPAIEISLNEIITEVLVEVDISRDEVINATFALAGIDWKEDLELFAPVMQRLRFENNSFLINDSIAALFAGIPTGIGCVSIAGTGGKSAGRSAEKEIQTMGMDLGEGGGAGQLVSVALNYIARVFHGTAPESKLTQVIPAALGFKDVVTFFKAIARENLTLSEDLAPIIFELASSGDAGAIEVTITVAHQHGLDLQGVASRLDFQGEMIQIIRAGGLHTAKNSVFDIAFESEVTALIPRSSIRVLEIPPVFGSVIYGANKYFGQTPQTFLDNLNSTSKKGVFS